MEDAEAEEREAEEAEDLLEYYLQAYYHYIFIITNNCSRVLCIDLLEYHLQARQPWTVSPCS